MNYLVRFAPEAAEQLEERVIIAFNVDEHAKAIEILGVFYDGQDYESALIDPDD